MQIPSVGRIVMYHPQAGEVAFNDISSLECPAIVTRVVLGDVVNLQVFFDGLTGPSWRRGVANGTGPGTWAWPERV